MSAWPVTASNPQPKNAEKRATGEITIYMGG